MGAMIGPITLTVGQPYQVSLAQDTAYIELQNDSLYDVWVYFGEVAPTDLSNSNNTWHRVVRRQHNGVLPVEGYRGASARERVNNAIGAFKGVVWLLAVNPGGIALSGTVSGRNQVYLTPYAQGDGLPAHSSLSTQSDLTSQPRIIAVPMALIHSYAGRWAAGDPATKVLARAGLSSDQITNQQAFFYLYYAQLAPVSGIGAGMSFTIEVQPTDNTPAATGPAIVIARGRVESNLSGTAGTAYASWVFAPTWPFALSATTFPGAPSVYAGTTQLAIQLTYQAGTRLDIDYTVAGSNDLANNSYVGEIGWGQIFTQTGTAPIF